MAIETYGDGLLPVCLKVKRNGPKPRLSGMPDLHRTAATRISSDDGSTDGRC